MVNILSCLRVQSLIMIRERKEMLSGIEIFNFLFLTTLIVTSSTYNEKNLVDPLFLLTGITLDAQGKFDPLRFLFTFHGPAS